MLKRIINWLDRGRCECGRSFWRCLRWPNYETGGHLCYECWERQAEREREALVRHHREREARLAVLGACLIPSTDGWYILLIGRGQLRPDAPWVAELWEFAKGQKAGE